MLIDWFTVVAQIVNFLVLVFLLQHFLYGPIVRAMDERQHKIIRQQAEAEQAQQNAVQEGQRYQQERADLEERRQQILSAAVAEAEVQRKKLLQQARVDVDDVQQSWREAIEREKEEFLRELRQRAGHQIYAVARRALADLAHVDLEQQMASVFLHQLDNLDEQARREIVQSLTNAGPPLVVYSAFALSNGIQQQIRTVLQATAGNAQVRFETRPQLLAGIELKSPSRRMAWNLAHYLEQLEADVSALVEGELGTNTENVEGAYEPAKSESAFPIATEPVPGQ